MTPSRAEVDAFREAIGRRMGLRFDDDRLPQLQDVLGARVLATRAANVEEYLRALSDREIAELMRTLSVSETYFLRNAPHFRAVEELLRARAGRAIRMLSVGCSSGEEPYSLAIVAREILSESEVAQVSIVALDLNPDSLERARAGRYTEWSLRETPLAVARRWFDNDGRHFLLRAAIKSMVRFELQNFANPSPELFRAESYDVVFCRNVIMYLTPAVQTALVGQIARALVPGGLLFLGHAENLRGISSEFHLRHSHEAFFYERKVDTTPRAPEADGISWYEAIARSSNRIEELSRAKPERRAVQSTPAPALDALQAARALMEAERYQDALGALAGGTSDHPDALLLRAALLATTGESAAAERVCAELLEIDDLSSGAHYVMALCREHAGDKSGAREHHLLASYLDASFAMPHLHVGILARRAGDLVTARRELELALALLAKEDTARILLFGGGFGREGLMQLCKLELASCGGAS
jgi:chemotaxis protein methyltransferase CheR